MALAGQIALYFSPVVLDEIRRVTSYPKLVAKFRLNTTRVSTLLENLPKVAIIVPIVPKLWKYDRDPVTRITSISHLPRMPDLLFPEMRTYLIL
jgi:predicted nucleic acid-binding protein